VSSHTHGGGGTQESAQGHTTQQWCVKVSGEALRLCLCHVFKIKLESVSRWSEQ